MNLVFFGTPQIAADVLTYLVEKGHNISMVVTKPDRPKGRSGTPTAPAVKVMADRLGLPTIQPEKVSTEENANILKRCAPDLFVVVAYGEILKPLILTIPRLGSINLHASLLPKFRGAAPIQRALIEGEEETGVSIIRLVDKMDAGPVLLTKVLSLPESMNAFELFLKLQVLGQEALHESIKLIAQGKEQEEIQDESRVTFAPKLTPEEGKIDFQQPARTIHNLIRGAYPYAFCTITIRGKILKLKVLKSKVHAFSWPKGKIKEDQHRLIVGTAVGVIEFLEVQQEGKKRMLASDWLKGSYQTFSFI